MTIKEQVTPGAAGKDAKTYLDKVKCPQGHKTTTLRRVGTAGRVVRSYCRMCQCAYQIKAGPLPKEKA